MIRLVSPADLPALAALHAECFEEPWSAPALGVASDSPGVFVLVAETDGLEGFVMARVAADEAEILTLAVASSRRRRGVGRTLVEAARLRAAGSGVTVMFLEVGVRNQPAQALYRGLGFVEAGLRRGYYKAGSKPPEDALVLRLALD